MSDSEEQKGLMEDLLRKNKTKFCDFFQSALPRIAEEFWEAGLIAKETADKTRVMGVGNFTLASQLVEACHPSLVYYPEENFPKFIEVLKRHETMKLLAAEMESKFEQARELYINNLTHLARASYTALLLQFC